MPAVRFRLIIIFISILGSVGLWMLGVLLMPRGEQGDYGALIFNESVPDAEIRERLESHGFSGLISETGQWVLLDSFGGIERVPLHEYSSRLLPFDPRNDGYAEKLRSLFIHNEKRLVYIPLNSPVTSLFENRITAALGDIPYSFVFARENTGGARQAVWALLLLCGALGAFFLVRPLRVMVKPHAAALTACLPPLVPLALLGGSYGFALVSVLAGLAALIGGPFVDRLVSLYRRPNRVLSKVYLLLLFLLLFFYGTIASLCGLSLVFTLSAFVLFCGILTFSLWGSLHGIMSNGVSAAHPVVKQRNFSHHRFSPLPIFNRPALNFSFSWAMLPFALAACILAVMGLFVQVPFSADFPLPSADSLTEMDYDAHCRFQSTFSFRTLNGTEASDMSDYEFAVDGLPVYDLSAEEEALLGTVPPFPLSDLLKYLDTMEHGVTVQDRPDFFHGELLSALLPFLFMIPAVGYRKFSRKKSAEVRGFSRIINVKIHKS